jgi:hypothetical protein
MSIVLEQPAVLVRLHMEQLSPLKVLTFFKLYNIIIKAHYVSELALFYS